MFACSIFFEKRLINLIFSSVKKSHTEKWCGFLF